MSRTEPTVLLTYTDPDSDKGLEVLEADAYYAVMYKGRPINIRTWTNIDLRTIQVGPKYPKCVYSSSAPCINLCRKLNLRFNCDDFTVIIITGNSQRVLKYPPV